MPSDMYRYSLNNCLFEAAFEKVIEVCKCFPYFHTMTKEDSDSVCIGNQILCMYENLAQLGIIHTVGNKQEDNHRANFILGFPDRE